MIFLWFMGGFFGPSYLFPLGIVVLACVLPGKAFRPRGWHYGSLLAPALAYYGLEYGVKDRQQFNVPLVIFVLSVFASAVVIAARVTKQPRWLPIGAAIGALLAVILWLAVPEATLTMPG